MGFYFVVHTLLGIIAVSANLLVMQGRAHVGSVPLWVHRYGPLFAVGGLVACLMAVITTFVNYDLVWAGVTIAEIALGAMVAGMLSMGIRALLVVTSPISIFFILGALWKFWYL